MESCNMLDSASLLMSYLPAEDAEQLLQRMPASQAASIRGHAMGRDVPPAMRMATARRFIREMSEFRLGDRQHRVDAAETVAAFRFLARLLPSRLADVLAGEIPQMTATVLSRLPASRAADVLTLLPESYQLDVVHHLLDTDPVPEDVIRDLADSLADVIAKNEKVERPRGDGRAHLVALLQCADADMRRRLADAARCDGIELGLSQDSA